MQDQCACVCLYVFPYLYLSVHVPVCTAAESLLFPFVPYMSATVLSSDFFLFVPCACVSVSVNLQSILVYGLSGVLGSKTGGEATEAG